ncbi:hypothetical protein PQQ84_34790 [Paraburkholderia strydomiana]|uniref:hypothetical protein n=1 Tax=Paraburkholderia strydomiana TaxID=1245417 RepID=UPI0038B6FBF3
MAALMMSGMCASVQAELDGLFGELGERAVRTRGVSAQAFSKARRALSAELFERARARLIERLNSPNPVLIRCAGTT